MIEIDNLTVRFGGVTPLDGMTVTFESGTCGLIGPNGAGKTTCFNLLSGFFPPEFGFLVATNILVYNYVGGRGHFAGAIVGAIFLSLLSEPFRGSAYETIFFSIAMLATILFLPGGIITLPGKLAGFGRERPISAPTPSPAG